MTDWSGDLDKALASGDPAFMRAMLARVPKSVMQTAIPYLSEMGKSCVAHGKLEQALIYYDQLLEVAPDSVEWHISRAQVHFKLDRLAEAMQDAERIAALAPQQAIGHRLKAEAHDGLRERPQAVAAYRQALRFAPDDAKVKQRIQFLETELRKETLLRQTLNPEAADQSLRIELPPPPQVTFDPVLLDDPSIPQSFEKLMVDGLRQHLWRYSGQQSCKNALARLEDPAWLAAWDTALSAVAGSSVLCRGSELGVFALRALQHGAARVLIEEAFPLDTRIAGGIVQKHFLSAWHALHGAAVQQWSEQERRESFESFAKSVAILAPRDGQSPQAPCDYFIFPHIDHSLLGTGIVKAIRRYRQDATHPAARVLPAKARIYAQGIQWAYPATHFELRPMNRFRWSFYPQALELPPGSWTALTAPTLIGQVDFEHFAETVWDVALTVVAAGTMDAILYWFELDLGNARISNAPGSNLRCIRPAVQYTDPTEVTQPGEALRMRVHVKETRLHFQTQPAAAQLRSHALPSWYVPMLLDEGRNDAYRAALERASVSSPASLVLDIGAGCGLLSMMAAQAGAGRVIGCEQQSAICQIGKDIVELSRLGDRITIVNKECRSMQLGDDLAERADLAVFELFDCSLIGEGILHFLVYAREHLLTRTARFLPASARIRAMLIEYRLDRLWDIDLNLLNPYRFSPTFINVDAGKLAYRTLTEPFDLFSFDFSTATPTPEEKELTVPAICAGTAGALLFWFDLQLDDSCWISNAPDAQQSFHWKQGLQFLPELQVSTAMQLPLTARHDGSGLACRWKQEALPQEAFSRLPRFDPRWLAATQELEQQTGNLLQHCRQNPEEYRKVAELAQRFAIDPAAHDLDSAIAQRFAMTFCSAP